MLSFNWRSRCPCRRFCFKSILFYTTPQSVFTRRKIVQEFPTSEPKFQLIDQQCVVYNFKCDQCDAGYVGYTRGHLFASVDGHRSKTSSVRKHCDNKQQAGFWVTFAIVIMFWINARTSLIVSLMRCYSLNNYGRVWMYNQTQFA